MFLIIEKKSKEKIEELVNEWVIHIIVCVKKTTTDRERDLSVSTKRKKKERKKCGYD